MEYLVEFFDFFNNKKPELNNWKDKAEFLYSQFEKIKAKKPKDYYYLQANVEDKNYNMAYNTYSKKRVNIHLFFKIINDGYEVIDFNDVNAPKKQGTYKISKDEYDKYIKYAKDISDFLDDESDENHNKSSTFLDDNGNINFNEGDLAIYVVRANY